MLSRSSNSSSLTWVDQTTTCCLCSVFILSVGSTSEGYISVLKPARGQCSLRSEEAKLHGVGCMVLTGAYGRRELDELTEVKW